nr:stage V sporulation T C-terminal domain-containing protein [Pseudoflavonifractor capillosus]
MSELAGNLCEIMYRVLSVPVVVTDRDCCIAAGGVPRKEVLERTVSAQLEDAMEQRKSVRGDSEFAVLEGDGRYLVESVHPIVSHGDVLGSVLLLHGDVPVGETEEKMAQMAATFLGRHMES